MAGASGEKPVRNNEMSTLDLLDVLRERISRHELPPGAALREVDLCRQFGVSRSRVREALATLEERGLVERHPFRGASVTRLSHAQALDLFEAREALESYCVRLAVTKTAPESWEDMVALFDGPAEEVIAQERYDEYLSYLDRFRARVVEASDNAVLSALLETLHDRSRMLMRRIVILPGRMRQGLSEQRALVAAMRAGDADQAERLKRANIRGAREWFERFEGLVL